MYDGLLWGNLCVFVCVWHRQMYWLNARVLSATEQRTVIPAEGSVGVLNEMQSRVLCELEETVNNLRRKVTTVLMNNVQQQEEFTRLKDRLVEALEAEVNWHLVSCSIVLKLWWIFCLSNIAIAL